jgi:hypothetical protein
MHVFLNCLIILGSLLALLLLYIFTMALIATVKEFRQPKPSGMDASMGFGGELGIKHKRKTK